MQRTRSKEAFERSVSTFAGGVGSAARIFPEPLFIEREDGSHVIDIDGNDYIDYVIAYEPLIPGHPRRYG